jgi:GGDEF domain-containing protein
MRSPVIDQLLSIFRPIYKYFERNVVIGRYGIHEIFLLLDEQPEMLGPEAKRVAERRERIRHALAEIIDHSKRPRQEKMLTSAERAWRYRQRQRGGE